MENGHGDKAAIVWDSPVAGKRGQDGDWTSAKEVYTYKQLLEEVEILAGVLREEGVKKGDVVLVYSMYILYMKLDRIHVGAFTRSIQSVASWQRL